MSAPFSTCRGSGVEVEGAQAAGLISQMHRKQGFAEFVESEDASLGRASACRVLLRVQADRTPTKRNLTSFHERVETSAGSALISYSMRVSPFPAAEQS